MKRKNKSAARGFLGCRNDMQESREETKVHHILPSTLDKDFYSRLGANVVGGGVEVPAKNETLMEHKLCLDSFVST